MSVVCTASDSTCVWDGHHEQEINNTHIVDKQEPENWKLVSIFLFSCVVQKYILNKIHEKCFLLYINYCFIYVEPSR